MADDFFRENVFPEEIQEIRDRREAAGQASDGLRPEPRLDNELIGLAISGGGVRSASFALGVVQALARAGVLARVDLLSTVSGGGFLGSSISALLHRAGPVAGPDDFPLAHNPSAAEPPALAHVRAYAAYLTPDGGVDQLRIPALLLRGVLVNVFTVLPLILLAVLATWGMYQSTPAVAARFCGVMADPLSADALSWVAGDCEEQIWSYGLLLLCASGLILFGALSLSYPLVLRTLGRRFRWSARNQVGRLNAMVLLGAIALTALVPLMAVTRVAILTTPQELTVRTQEVLWSLVDPRLGLGALAVAVVVGAAAARWEVAAGLLRTAGLYTLGIVGPGLLGAVYLVLCVVTIRPQYVHASLVLDELREGRVGQRLARVLERRGVPDTYGRPVRAEPSHWLVQTDGGVLDVVAEDVFPRDPAAQRVRRDPPRVPPAPGACRSVEDQTRAWYVAGADGLKKVARGSRDILWASVPSEVPRLSEPVDGLCPDILGQMVRVHGGRRRELRGVVDGLLARSVLDLLRQDDSEPQKLAEFLALPATPVDLAAAGSAVWRLQVPGDEEVPLELVQECSESAGTPLNEVPLDATESVLCELGSGFVGTAAAAALGARLGDPVEGVTEVLDGQEVRDRVRISGPQDQHTLLLGASASMATAELRAGRVPGGLRIALDRAGVSVPDDAVLDHRWVLPVSPGSEEQVWLYPVSGGLVRIDREGAGGSVGWLAALAVAMLLFGWLLYDVNLTSLHRFYRDRLSRAWLVTPDGDRVRHVDDLKLSELRAEGSQAPYHIVQAAVNVSDRLPELHGRAADFFVFTKRWVGGPLAGWCRTERMERFDRRLDLGTAIAISGAAAAPQMGSATIRPLAFVMTLLNVRMGYWLPNPRLVRTSKPWQRAILGGGPGPLYLLYEALGMVNLSHAHVFTTDGGHIENLGVHELLRRRCRFIVAVDAEADADRMCPSLMQVVRYARMDLGIEIDIEAHPFRLGPDGLSARSWGVGIIRYGPGEEGVLLYLKSTLTGREPDDVQDEQRIEPSFPHVSTADQFFTPQRFEAYRALGLWTATTALREAIEEGSVAAPFLVAAEGGGG